MTLHTQVKAGAPNATIHDSCGMKTTVKQKTLSLKPELDEADALAQRFFSNSVSYQHGFVTWQDMVSFAETCGAICVVKKPLSLSGLSMPIGDTWAIIINEGEPPERQRFTLAHEIAHLFMTKEMQRQVWQATPSGPGDTARKTIEGFCDNLAARILMPKPLLSTDLEGKSLAPDLLVNLAWKYGISLRAFSIRAVEMLNGDHHVAKWDKVSDQKGQQHLYRKWRAAARGMKNLMPETTTMRSPVGELFENCVLRSSGSYSGEIVRETKRENLVMQGWLLHRGPSPSVLAVTHRIKLGREPSPVRA